MKQFNIKTASMLFLFSIVTVVNYGQEILVGAKDNRIVYEGRVPFKQDTAELTWPGTSIYINFKGKSISGVFKDADTANYYNIIIDKKTIKKFHFDTTKQTYLLASDLADSNHTLQIFKRTEWDKGRTYFYGFVPDSSEVLNVPILPVRKIEFFGNSITCGYAIEDTTGDSPAGYFENNYNSYAAITARYFNAQYYCTSKSGIGVMVSWFPLIMPEMYNRLDAEDSTSVWDFSKYVPDVVVINLFQNDSWIINLKDNKEFKHRFGTQAPDSNYIIAAYKNFVQTIRNKYPLAKIICMLGSMDITKQGSAWPGYVQDAVSELKDRKVYTFFAPYKNTTGHPKTKEQQQLAQELIDFINKNIQW